MPKSYWLLKTEPEDYSIDDLKKDRTTNWNHIRNYQARNFLRTSQPGDTVLIYHSGDERSVVGIGEVASKPYEDPDPERKGDWVQVDVKFKEKIAKPLPLEEMRKEPGLKNLLLFKQSRLSVIPISDQDYTRIIELTQRGGAS